MPLGLREDDNDDEEDMVDILEARRQSSDVSHALRTFRPPSYRGAKPFSADQLNTAVLASHNVRSVIVEVSTDPKSTQKHSSTLKKCHSFVKLKKPIILRVTQVAMETGSPPEVVRAQAAAILEEMSQKLQLGFVRLMGFMLSKVLKRIYSHIYVNMDALRTVATFDADLQIANSFSFHTFF